MPPTFGPREQVANGRTGLLVPRGDPAALATALRRLVHDPTGRQALGTAARTDALARFTEAAVAAHTLALFGL